MILSGPGNAARMVPAERKQRADSQGQPGGRPALSTIAFLVAALLLVTSAVTLNVFLGRVAENRAFVLRTSSILRDMAELNADVRAAETGQ